MLVTTLMSGGKSSVLVFAVECQFTMEVFVLGRVQIPDGAEVERVRLGTIAPRSVLVMRDGAEDDPWARYRKEKVKNGWMIVESTDVDEAFGQVFGAEAV